MSLDDIRLRETIDLQDRVAEVREDIIPELEERIDDAEDAKNDGESPEPDPSPGDLRDLRDRLDGQAKACERVVEALDGGAFVIQELMTTETAILTDDVSEQSIDVDYERQQVSGAPKEGYHKVRTLELSLVEAPEAMETRMDREIGREIYTVGKLPDHVSDYLYQCVLALNDAGEVDGVGNLSDYGVPSGGS